MYVPVGADGHSESDPGPVHTAVELDIQLRIAQTFVFARHASDASFTVCAVAAERVYRSCSSRDLTAVSRSLWNEILFAGPHRIRLPSMTNV
jgi:hypothetical protein